MSPEQFWPLIQVILVDLMLAADNAIVIGLAAASVPAALRPRVIMLGIAAAAVLRILFALVTVQLLQIVGLVLAGVYCSCGSAGNYGGNCAVVMSRANQPMKNPLRRLNHFDRRLCRSS